MPKVMKKFLIADPDYIFYNIDLSQAENRIVAYIAPEPVLIKAFEDEIDVHSLTASMIFGIPYEDIIDMNDKDVMCDIGTGEYPHRFWGKKANHAFNYGETPYKFSLQNEMPIKQATEIQTIWLRMYPGVEDYWSWVQADLRKDMTLYNLFDRKRTFLRWWDDALKEAYSFIPQSSVAEITNQLGLNYIWKNKEKFAGLRLLNIVHDSIHFELPISMKLTEHYRIVTDIVKSLEVEMTFRGKKFFIPCDVEVGFNLKDMTEIDKYFKYEPDEFILTVSKTIFNGEQ